MTPLHSLRDIQKRFANLIAQYQAGQRLIEMEYERIERSLQDPNNYRQENWPSSLVESVNLNLSRIETVITEYMPWVGLYQIVLRKGFPWYITGFVYTNLDGKGRVTIKTDSQIVFPLSDFFTVGDYIRLYGGTMLSESDHNRDWQIHAVFESTLELEEEFVGVADYNDIDSSVQLIHLTHDLPV